MTTTTPATITATYPCHPGRRVRLDTMSRRYDRRCPVCGAAWVLDRATLIERPGARIDQVTWNPDPARSAR